MVTTVKGKKGKVVVQHFDPHQAIEQRFNSMRELTHKRNEQGRSFAADIESLEAKLAKAKADLAEKVGPLDKQIQALESEIEEIARDHKPKLLGDSKVKTVSFSAGTVSWIKSPDSVQILNDDSEAAAEELIAQGLEDLVKISKSPIKAAMLRKPEIFDKLRLSFIKIGSERVKVELTKL